LSPAYIAYKNSDSVRAREELLNDKTRLADIAYRICNELFTKEFAQRLLNGEIKTGSKQKTYTALSLVQDLFDLYTMRFSIRKEMQAKGLAPNSINFGACFNEKDARLLNHIGNASDFLEKGPAFNAMGIQVRNAAPLLIDFIKTTDASINQPAGSDAVLRFTHAEAISPFAALLGIPEASTSTSNIHNYDAYWNAATIIPLSANIQWILYRNGQEYFVKVLLNEKEVRLPIATQTWPYYQWNAVRAYYLQLLQKLHTSLDADMRQYLSNLAQ